MLQKNRTWGWGEEEGILPDKPATSFPHRGASGITVGRGSSFIKRGGAPLRKARGGVPAGIPCESLMCLHGLPPPRGDQQSKGTLPEYSHIRCGGHRQRTR